MQMVTKLQIADHESTLLERLVILSASVWTLIYSCIGSRFVPSGLGAGSSRITTHWSLSARFRKFLNRIGTDSWMPFGSANKETMSRLRFSSLTHVGFNSTGVASEHVSSLGNVPSVYVRLFMGEVLCGK